MKKLFLLLLLISISACSTKSYILRKDISGCIQDQENRPIENVEIKFVGNDAFSPIPLKSDKNGCFFIERLVFKKYKDVVLHQNTIATKFTLSKEGYTSETINLEDYKYNRSMVVADTIKLGTIHLKK
ncbi:hypothetical protein [Flavobacterium sp. '19STA2R22 D10 B1']|uniref:hypothetical protein n=1 Tax=Flavobacterium aerium TaxID=3037261 RepID=UPI00278C439F|nr:hypothetical protein [Flavobacterium sp. '19STA2R22 D10 B1']